jgi:hypothetical protein
VRGGLLELTIASVIGTHFHKREPLSGHFGGYFIRSLANFPYIERLNA